MRIDSEQPQSFSAGFELTGNAQTGALVLTSPLGSTLAALNWTPHTAVMRANGDSRRFDSLDELLQNATGAAIPIATLFAWLRGDHASAPGWLADLSQLAQGRLMARRATPSPAVELRLVLEP
jgi:outer membrane lipoprotein LolB